MVRDLVADAIFGVEIRFPSHDRRCFLSLRVDLEMAKSAFSRRVGVEIILPDVTKEGTPGERTGLRSLPRGGLRRLLCQRVLVFGTSYYSDGEEFPLDGVGG